MRKVITASIAVLAVAGAASIVAATADAHPPSRVLEFVEHETNTVQLDLGAPGPSVGDAVVADNPLFDRSNKKRVGTVTAECVRTSQNAPVYHCNSIFRLKDGLITKTGVIDLNMLEIEGAVTGGTGKYSVARGEWSARVGTELTPHRVVLTSY